MLQAMEDRAVTGEFAGIRIAVLIPCYNEAVAIPAVVAGFRAALPGAAIFVYDNNSKDGTAEAARAAGAIVRRERLQGKGQVIRRMFADVDADAYVLVDGDATYDPASAPDMLRLLLDERLDMVNGARVTEIEAAYRRGHRLGNQVLTGIVAWVFGDLVTDMLSGYRVFSRRFVKSFPALASGFETETEFTVHALELRMPVGEVATPYKDRPEGSASKLRTYSDGLRILRTIMLLVKEERPLQFFALAALLLVLLGVRPRDTRIRGLRAHRPGSPRAHGGAVHGPCAACHAVAHLRADPRFGVTRAEGEQAHGIPRVSSAGLAVGRCLRRRSEAR